MRAGRARAPRGGNGLLFVCFDTLFSHYKQTVVDETDRYSRLSISYHTELELSKGEKEEANRDGDILQLKLANSGLSSTHHSLPSTPKALYLSPQSPYPLSPLPVHVPSLDLVLFRCAFFLLRCLLLKVLPLDTACTTSAERRVGSQIDVLFAVYAH